MLHLLGHLSSAVADDLHLVLDSPRSADKSEVQRTSLKYAEGGKVVLDVSAVQGSVLPLPGSNPLMKLLSTSAGPG